MTENEAICVLRRGYSYSLKDQLEALKMSIKALEEVQEYRKLGTVESVKESVLRDSPEEITEIEFHGVYFHECPICNETVDEKDNYCRNCGQRLESEE